MGQSEVINFLEKCKEPKTRKQIADALKAEASRISYALKKLLRWKEIKFIERDRHEASQMVGYILLRRTRFYYVD